MQHFGLIIAAQRVFWMPIKSETRLGPYEIVSVLGAGGMGEVYRARDPRLGREVAIKVLPVAWSADVGRLHRFEQEARAAAALNHPNILAVHDIGSQDGAPYIVSEVLDGATLRERLRTGPLPIRKAAEYAQQIACGLAAAHDKGIVHRDLKPENIFITDDGRVKILDFGLAKLTRPESMGDGQTLTQTLPSDNGTVLGTVGYMSPEQVRGKPADARSDLFSFGAILYEMLAGKRAFHGESAAETMSAIVKEEPAELGETNRSVPPALERIVRHCLEKNPQERFQSARDIAFDLESITSVSGPSTTAPKRVRFRSIPIAFLLMAFLVGAGVVGWRVIARPATTQPEFRRLTFRRGSIRMARFAQDGQTIFYGAAWDGKPVELFAMQYGTSESRPLGVAAQVLSISKAGEAAVLLNPKVWNFVQTGTLALMPLSGGAPRELLDEVQFAEWSPDSKALAVVRFSMASGLSWIEYPTGKVIYRGDPAWIGHLRISPDGNFLAFEQHIHNGDDGYVVITDRDGNKKFATQVFTSLQGLAWRPDGKEVWFTAAPRGSARAIYALTTTGKQRLILRVPGALVLHDIAVNGRVLLTNDNARKQMFALVQTDNKEHNVSWLDWSVLQVLSEDGKQVLFTEGGEAALKYGLYLRRLDGSLPKRIVDGYWGDLSPDGKWVIAQDTSTPAQFVLVPTGIGESRQITHDDLTHLYPRFMPDGHSIVFVATTPQRGVRIYYQSLDGGEPIAITPEGSGGYPSLIPVSPDGRYLIAPGITADAYAMYPVRGGEPRPVKGLSTEEAVINWSADGKYLFTYRRGEVPAHIYRVEISSGERELFRITSPPDLAGVEDVTNMTITRDGRSYAYTCPTVLSDLYVVDGLR
jgi:Tol biopolymer transport system component